MSEIKDLDQHISVCIDNLLLDLPDSPDKPSIFRVSNELRYVNEKLYEPKVLAIGPFYHRKNHLEKMTICPFHHRKSHLQKMEQHKLQYLKRLLKRRDESRSLKYVMAIRSLEQKARGCYAEPINLSSDDFVQMLLLDGIFIIELIRKYRFNEFRERDDTIFQHEHILSQLRQDFMLVENQVPFFVLEKLFSMTKSESLEEDILLDLIPHFIHAISPWPDASKISVGEVSMGNIDHLLGLVYRIWCSSFTEMTASRPDKAEEDRIWCCSFVKEKKLTIDSTTELREAGIKFLKYTDKDSHFLDIKFTKRVMKIPGIHVSDATESVLGNLIAYEHLVIDNDPKYMTDYAFLWDCLINSSKDVEILRRDGIVTNFLGDDEKVCLMFNHLGKNSLTSSKFCYRNVFTKVNEHCDNPWNSWRANLKHKYFNTPWAFLSFLAALVLLVFAFTQTLFSVLSYTKY